MSRKLTWVLATGALLTSLLTLWRSEPQGAAASDCQMICGPPSYCDKEMRMKELKLLNEVHMLTLSVRIFEGHDPTLKALEDSVKGLVKSRMDRLMGEYRGLYKKFPSEKPIE